MKDKEDSREKARQALLHSFATFQFKVGERTWKREDLYDRRTVPSSARQPEKREHGTEN